MEKSKARPWWREPVWLITVGFSVLVLTSAYLYARHEAERSRIRALAHTSILVGDLIRERSPSKAIELYREAIQLIHDQGGNDPKLLAYEAEAQSKIDQINKLAKQEPPR